MVNVLSSSSSMPITAPWANRKRGGERENGKSRQSDRDTSYSTFHFDLRALNMSPTGSHLLINPSHSQQLTLFSSKAQFPVASSSFSSKTKINHRLSLSLSRRHTKMSAVFWNMVEKKGGEEVGFGRVKEEKGREGWRERKSTPGSSSQKGKKELQRNGLLAGWGISS